MTGIAAALEHRNRVPDRALLERMARALPFYGPSTQRTHTDSAFDGVCTSAPVGRSPMLRTSANGVSVVAASRLDARPELVSALRPAAVDADMPDAELLLRAYQRWGSDLLQHIIGDFAFVLWDPTARRLLAATDQFGVRPVFYAHSAERLLVSNVLPALRDSGDIDTMLNENFIGDVLSLGFSTDQTATIHAGIRRLPPGHRLVWSDGALRVDPYWRVASRNSLLLYRSTDEYAQHFRDVFFRAVADRLPMEGAIGIMMSGGTDSTSVAAASQSTLGPDQAARRVTAYTTVYRDHPEEEGPYATAVARHLGIRSTITVAEDYCYKPYPTHSGWRRAEPGAISEHTPEQEAAMELSHTGGTLLTGLGGDSLLAPAGPALAETIRLAGWRAPLTLARYAFLFHQSPRTGLRRVIGRHVRRATRLPAAPWVDSDFARRTRLAERLADYVQHTIPGGPARLVDPFWSHIVALGDPGQTGMSMAQAHPFFDTRLLELVSRLPEPLLQEKRILRDAMAAYLPRAILRRPKTILGASHLVNRRNLAVIARQEALLHSVPELSVYVNFDVLRRCIRSPEHETASPLHWAENLGFWLRGTGIAAI